MQTQSSSDIEVWEAFCEGNRTAFAELYIRFYNDLYLFGLQICSDENIVGDAIQEFFFYLWEKRKGIKDIKNLKSYLFISFKRLVRKEVKNKLRVVTFSEIDHPIIPSFESSWLNDEEFQQQQAFLARELSLLPPQQREVLYLKFFQFMSYEEISEIMAIDIKVARNYVYRALTTIRKHNESFKDTIYFLSLIGIYL